MADLLPDLYLIALGFHTSKADFIRENLSEFDQLWGYLWKLNETFEVQGVIFRKANGD